MKLNHCKTTDLCDHQGMHNYRHDHNKLQHLFTEWVVNKHLR